MGMGFNGQMTLSTQCKDRVASREWYKKNLGFELLYDVAEIGWCELSTCVEGVNLGLSEVEKPKVGQGPVPTFGVEDIDIARKQLEGAGVKFDGDTITIPDMVRLATFYDPDENALMLFQQLGGM